MSNINFNNIMWSPRDTLDPKKLSLIQKNSDNIYQQRIYNARGLLAKTTRTSSLSVPTGTNALYIINASSLSFTTEKNRAIGFGFSAPFITEDTAGSGTLTNSYKDALPTIGVSIDGETTVDDSGTNNATAESARAINLWNARISGTVNPNTIFDGFGISLYYICTRLTSGSHTADFWVRNSAVSGVGSFTIKASTIFPMVMWVEDLGSTRAYG